MLPQSEQDNSSVFLFDVFKKALLIRDEKESGETMYKAFKLAEKLETNNIEIDFKSEDIVLLKKKLEVYSIIVYGQCCDILEGEK